MMKVRGVVLLTVKAIYRGATRSGYNPGMARIAIVGVGAIGGVVASLLQSSGRHELVLCTRRPMKGLVVESPAIGLRSDMDAEIRPEVRINAKICTQPEEAEPVDWVMIATKAYDVPSAAGWLEFLRGEETPV